MLTVLEIIKRSTEFLAGKGVENPRLNAELLIGQGLGLKRMQLYLQFERPLTESELEQIRPLVRRRGQREPLQYIVGETEFCGLTLKVDRRALIPRPETELLVELVVARVTTAPARILDLGTGTGALALALAKAFPEAQVTAVDASAEALALAEENGRENELGGRVSWLRSDWFAQVPEESKFELIVSNPPYLTAAETNEALPEVKEFEPLAALTGAGAEGAGDLLKIIELSPRYLAAGGVLALETGIAQHAMLLESCARAGLVKAESLQDLTKRDRFVIARQPE
jgi:protein-(glutamine-N5) methyltransferase, release factor-specific